MRGVSHFKGRGRFGKIAKLRRDERSKKSSREVDDFHSYGRREVLVCFKRS